MLASSLHNCEMIAFISILGAAKGTAAEVHRRRVPKVRSWEDLRAQCVVYWQLIQISFNDSSIIRISYSDIPFWNMSMLGACKLGRSPHRALTEAPFPFINAPHSLVHNHGKCMPFLLLLNIQIWRNLVCNGIRFYCENSVHSLWI